MTYLNPALRKEIILAILDGRAEETFERNGLDTADQALMVTAAHRALDAGVNYRYPFKRFSTARRRVPLLIGYLVAGAVLLALLSCGAFLHTHIDYGNRTDYPLVAALVALLGFSAATIGWSVTSWTSGRNARAQHTINILSSRYSNTLYSDAAATFNSAFKDSPVTSDMVKRLVASSEQADKEALQAVRYLLNWFEFVSAGVLLGDLDLTIVERTVRSNLLFYCDKCIAFILTEQARNPRTLRNLMELADHFRTA